jgi:hypothetical protein
MNKSKKLRSKGVPTGSTNADLRQSLIETVRITDTLARNILKLSEVLKDHVMRIQNLEEKLGYGEKVESIDIEQCEACIDIDESVVRCQRITEHDGMHLSKHDGYDFPIEWPNNDNPMM